MNDINNVLYNYYAEIETDGFGYVLFALVHCSNKTCVDYGEYGEAGWRK